MRPLLFVAVFWASMAAMPDAGRADRPLPLTELGVDQVSVRKGPRLLGAVLERTKDGTIGMAVSRDWLKRQHAKYYEIIAARESEEEVAALKQLRVRISVWQKEREGDSELSFFLKKQGERIEQALTERSKKLPGDESELLFLTIPPAQVERVFLQPATRKQVAAVAWRERLKDVESRSTRSLTAELQQQGIHPDREVVDLSDRLPLRRQSGSEWAARQAIVEYQYRKPLDFQGTGDVVVRTGEGAKAADVGALLVSVLRGQIAGQLSELLEGAPKQTAADDTWLRAATAATEAEGATGFRVTRVSTDAGARGPSVETRFVAKLPNGKWETVWRQTTTVDVSKADKERVDRIAQDPQIKQVLELMQATGLEAGEEQIREALRYGAATMQAQEEADVRFFAFRDRYLQSLERPALPLGDLPK